LTSIPLSQIIYAAYPEVASGNNCGLRICDEHHRICDVASRIVIVLKFFGFLAIGNRAQ
jgi:hypothetical protein